MVEYVSEYRVYIGGIWRGGRERQKRVGDTFQILQHMEWSKWWP